MPRKFSNSDTLTRLTQQAGRRAQRQPDVAGTAGVEWEWVGALATALCDTKGQSHQSITSASVLILRSDPKLPTSPLPRPRFLPQPPPQACPPPGHSLPTLLLTCFPPALGHKGSCGPFRLLLGPPPTHHSGFFGQFSQWGLPVPCLALWPVTPAATPSRWRKASEDHGDSLVTQAKDLS